MPACQAISKSAEQKKVCSEHLLRLAHWGVNSFGFGDKDIHRDMQVSMKIANHGDRKSAAPIQHFRNARAGTQSFRQITPRDSLLVHAETNGVDGIGRQDGKLTALIIVDDQSKKLHLRKFSRARLGVCVHKAFQLPESGFVGLFIVNDSNVHV
jgi:hypothetical protein